MNIFELNPSMDVSIEQFSGISGHLRYNIESKIYTINNFYRYPEKVVNYINSRKSTLHKKEEDEFHNITNNSHFFDDRRFDEKNSDVNIVYNFLYNLTAVERFNYKEFIIEYKEDLYELLKKHYEKN